MINSKTLWTVLIILLLIGVFAFGYSSIKDNLSGEKDNVITGNIIYESVEPNVMQPIKVKSLIFNK